MSSQNPLLTEKQTITVYGIPNCDSVKRARAALAQHKVVYLFHDLSKDPLSVDTLAGWCKALGVAALLNRKSTTWRQLDETQQQSVGDCASVCALLLKHPKLIKRPVVQWPEGPTAGLDALLDHLHTSSHFAATPL